MLGGQLLLGHPLPALAMGVQGLGPFLNPDFHGLERVRVVFHLGRRGRGA